MSTNLINDPRFLDMVENLRAIGGGPSGPPIEGRLLAAELAKGLGFMPTAASGIKVEPAYFDMLTVRGDPNTQAPAAYIDRFRKHLDAANRDWPDYFKHLFWVIVSSDTSTMIAAGVQYATYDDFVEAIKAGAPALGTIFSESVYVFGYDLVDVSDSYPNIRRVRNSMFSAIRGRKRHQIRRAGDTSGVASNFNAGTFYQDAGWIDKGSQAVTWHNNLVRNLLWEFLSADPGSNNDGAIWASWGKRTRWNMPKVGSTLTPGAPRGAVWDTTTSAYITPAPVGVYQVGAPIMLYDWRGQGILNCTDVASLNQGNYYTMNMVGVVAFPVINSARYHAFLIYPFGADTWYTEYLDPTLYDLVVRTNFRHERQALYHIVPASQHNQTAESMFNIWNKDKSGGSQLWKTITPGAPPLSSATWWARSNIDNDKMPIGFDVCRRNKSTGIRSSYKPLFKIRRRIPHGNSRIDPAFL